MVGLCDLSTLTTNQIVSYLYISHKTIKSIATTIKTWPARSAKPRNYCADADTADILPNHWYNQNTQVFSLACFLPLVGGFFV